MNGSNSLWKIFRKRHTRRDSPALTGPNNPHKPHRWAIFSDWEPRLPQSSRTSNEKSPTENPSAWGRNSGGSLHSPLSTLRFVIISFAPVGRRCLTGRMRGSNRDRCRAVVPFAGSAIADRSQTATQPTDSPSGTTGSLHSPLSTLPQELRKRHHATVGATLQRLPDRR